MNTWGLGIQFSPKALGSNLVALFRSQGSGFCKRLRLHGGYGMEGAGTGALNGSSSASTSLAHNGTPIPTP